MTNVYKIYRQLIYLTVLTLFSINTALAQTPILTQSGVATNESLGFAVSSAGDVDGDGVVDIITSAASYPVTTTTNKVRVISGISGATIYEYTGSANNLFGYSVTGLGDLNSDGRAEFAITEPLATAGVFTATGIVYVYSGINGNLLFSFNGQDANAQLGSQVRSAGDVNADGTNDIIVGAPYALNQAGTLTTGGAIIYSGIDGSIIRTLYGTTANQLLGLTVDGLGDINNDGKSEVIAGGANIARVYSGANGSVLYSKTTLGLSNVSKAGDVDNNTTPDFMVGVFNPALPSAGGTLRVYSGSTGSTIHEIELNITSFGSFADVNADGKSDFLTADASTNTVAVLSGANASLLYAVTGPANSQFAKSISSFGDINGDGQPEVLVGAPQAGEGSLAAAGKVYAYSLINYPCASLVDLGPSCGGALLTANLPVVGGYWKLSGSDLPLSFVYVFASGATTANFEIAPACFIYLDPASYTLLGIVGADSSGYWSLPEFFLNNYVPAGLTFNFQSLSFQANGLNFSNGLQLTTGYCSAPNPQSTPAPTPTPTATPTPTPTPTPTATPTPTPTPSTIDPTFGNAGYNPPPVPNLTVPTEIASATEFLYTGTNPIQTGVAPNTIEATRVAVLRGKVVDPAGNPLQNVTVKILNRPEFGQTVTRSDGMFDMAANGGGYLTVNYEMSGYLPVQRQVKAPWRDFVMADDVMMTAIDTAMTSVNLAAQTTMIAHSANVVVDQDGTRTARILVPTGTTATMKLPDGSTQPLTTVSLRASEFTVGEDGPMAMPGTLPPSSGYTYAAELSVDEAMAVGASEVTFNQPLPFYVDNFLNFPVGMIVPAGYYDRQKGNWIPSDNGKVIKIVSINNGQAVISINADGTTPATPAELTSLGVTTAELQNLATIYVAGATLWRTPIKHFTPWDLNLSLLLPSGATNPKTDPPKGNDKNNPPNGCLKTGSIIECEGQTLREEIPIAGTSFSLNYSSERQKGRIAASTITIPLSDSTLPSGVIAINLEVHIAGKIFKQNFAPQPNLQTTYTWDGLNAYGQILQGSIPAVVRIGYAYSPVYALPSTLPQSFGIFSGVPVNTDPSRNEVIMWTDTTTTLRRFDETQSGLGGWRISSHGVYDTYARELYINGGKERAENQLDAIITTVAGNGTQGFSGDGGPATLAQFHLIADIAAGLDGSIYVVDKPPNRRVRRISPDGIISTFAGNGAQGYGGDGGPATQAQLSNPGSIAVGPDGSVYVQDASKIRRITPDGIINTVAGNGNGSVNNCSGVALSVGISPIYGLAIGKDNSIYFITQPGRVCKISPNGILSPFAGIGTLGFTGDGGPATQAKLNFVAGLGIGPDESIYLADSGNNRVRRVTPDGIINTVAGNGISGFTGDGGSATAARLYGPSDVAIAGDGAFYIMDYYNDRVRKVSSDGIISTFAGKQTPFVPQGYSGNNGPATNALLNLASYLEFPTNGNLIISDVGNNRVRQIVPSLNGYKLGDIIVKSNNSQIAYKFDSVGRHIWTKNTLTNQIILSFDYDSSGRLNQITDADNNITTINYDANGTALSIAAPFGQITNLLLDANGHLTTLTNPTNESHHFTYTADGLLTSMMDPLGGMFNFSYDPEGRLTMDQEPLSTGGSQSLSRTSSQSGGQSSFTVQHLSSLNRTTSYLVEQLSNGDTRRRVNLPDGTFVDTVMRTNGSSQTTGSDGMISDSILTPDPLFAMQSPITSTFSTKTPLNLTLSGTSARTATLAVPTDPLTLQTLTDTVTVNGKTATTVYDAATKVFTSTSPANRVTTTTIDLKGRPIQTTVPNFAAVNMTYDLNGRPDTVSQGTGIDQRLTTYIYDPTSGYLDTIIDPLLRATSFNRDLAGRVTQQTLPDGRVVQFSYDANGNLASLTPPGRPAHTFQYNAINNTSNMTSPTVLDGGTNQTSYIYDIDRQLTSITRPDGAQVVFNYEATSGKLSSQVIPTGSTNYTYSATTGQLTSVSGPYSETTSYTYDGALIKQVSLAGPVTGSVQWTYNNDFNVTNIKVNNTNQVNYTYDNDNLLTTAGALTISRNAANGVLTGTTLGTINDAFTYNTFAEIANYTANYNSTVRFNENITLRDNLGRIVDRTESVQGGAADSYHYDYDLAGRLTQVTKNGSIFATYTYDTNSNRLSKDLTTATYDAQDKLLTYGNLSFTYTPNGELLTKTGPAGTTTYNYDVKGSLLSVTPPTGAVIDYVIDSDGRRVGKKVGGVLQKGWIYQNGLNPIAELSATNTVVSRFVYGTKPNVPDYMFKAGVTYRIISDHLGSVRLVVNTTTGAVIQRMDYDEFGVVTNDTNPNFQPFGFAGGLYDTDTKLTRFGARDYDAETGRWTSKDPIGFAGGDTNLFGYVMGDPVNLIDPNGLFFTSTGYTGVNHGQIEAHYRAQYEASLKKKSCPETNEEKFKRYKKIGTALSLAGNGITLGSSYIPHFVPKGIGFLVGAGLNQAGTYIIYGAQLAYSNNYTDAAITNINQGAEHFVKNAAGGIPAAQLGIFTNSYELLSGAINGE